MASPLKVITNGPRQHNGIQYYWPKYPASGRGDDKSLIGKANNKRSISDPRLTGVLELRAAHR